jgi:hypothetical protein
MLMAVFIFSKMHTHPVRAAVSEFRATTTKTDCLTKTPDDLDGDGNITQMRIKDPNGEYKADPKDPRILVRIEPGEKGEYTLLGSEGIDNDKMEDSTKMQKVISTQTVIGATTGCQTMCKTAPEIFLSKVLD